MKFKYKNKEYPIPASLSKITLGQRIEFDNIYAKEIESLHTEIFKVDEEGSVIEPDEVEVMVFNVSIATKNLSFFTGIPLHEVESNIALDDVLNIYHSCFKQIYEQQSNVILQDEYLWNDEIWIIEQPELSFESKITFNELIVSKQIAKQMHELGAGNWEAMLYLAAIFLKREGETFQESWMSADSERTKMMYELPLDIAIAVGFFLQNSMNIYTITSQYLEKDIPGKVPT